MERTLKIRRKLQVDLRNLDQSQSITQSSADASSAQTAN